MYRLFFLSYIVTSSRNLCGRKNTWKEWIHSENVIFGYSCKNYFL